MRVPISWLRDYVDVELPYAALAERLTNAGLEVGSLELIGVAGAPLEWDRERVLLARVLAVEPHPDADRLLIATVEYGAAERKRVVTGAPNLRPLLGADLATRALYSPLLLEGGTFLDPHKDGKPTRLQGKSLRGIYNDAMLCSPVELGLGEDHDGILLIEDDSSEPRYRAGSALVDVLGDVVLEIEIIPNIARCASVLGVAREVAALTGVPLRYPSFEVEMTGAPIAGRVEIHSEHPELNPRFVALLVEGVAQHPAPFWMQHRLHLAGQRPINAVVDVSNYVMLELGQPIHTFDYGILRARADRYAPGGPVRLETRLPRAGETLRTLDGTERRLEPNNILVSDPLGNLGLGGIMGGENSEISADTRDVLVEAAAWNFINIRRSARQLGLNTEASFRFSRGVHPAQTLLGARRAAELLRRYAGGTVAQGVVDHHPRPAPARTVVLDPREVARATGLKIDGSRIAELLRRLEFAVDRVDGAGGEGERLTVIAPDHRLDIEGPHDLVEEVCRMIGYENIPSTVLRDALPPQRGNPALEREERIRDALVAQGLREVITYRLTTPEAEARARVVAEERDYVRLANPSTAERVVLRYDLLASVLEIAAANARFQDRLALFEVGPVFPRRAGTVLPEELCRLAVVQSGAREGEHWSGGAAPHYDFFDLKGVLEDLASELKVSLAFTAGEHPSLRPGRTATVELADGGAIGIAGELHPTVAERYGLGGAERPVLVAMLDLELLLPRIPETFGVAPVAVYPAVHEDVALVLESSVPASSVERALRAGGGELLREVELFDVFTGPQLGAGKRSLAYHLTYQAPDRTLTDREVERLRKRIVERAAREVGAVLRE